MQIILIFILGIFFVLLINFFKKYSNEEYTLNPPTDVNCRLNPITCPAGTYCPGNGTKALTDAIPCPAGSYCIDGSLGPTKCPAGTYCPNMNTKALADAIQCPAGSYCPEGSTQPIQCPAGTFCSNMNTKALDDAIQCPAGAYCIAGSVGPTQCPAGSYCIAGSVGPTQCPDSYYCIPGSVGPTQCPSYKTYCPAGSATYEYPNCRTKYNNVFASDDGSGLCYVTGFGQHYLVGPLSRLGTVYTELNNMNLFVLIGNNKKLNKSVDLAGTSSANSAGVLFQGNIGNAGSWNIVLVTYSGTNPPIRVVRFIYNGFCACYDNIYNYARLGLSSAVDPKYSWYSDFNFYDKTNSIYTFKSVSTNNFISVQS